MRYFISFLIILFLCGVALADKIEVPFNCYPKEIQKAFKAKGMKLDLNGNDRTKDSWGFIVNEGTRYNLFTYSPMADKDFDKVLKIILKLNKGK